MKARKYQLFSQEAFANSIGVRKLDFLGRVSDTQGGIYDFYYYCYHCRPSTLGSYYL